MPANSIAPKDLVCLSKNAQPTKGTKNVDKRMIFSRIRGAIMPLLRVVITDTINPIAPTGLSPPRKGKK